LLGLPSYSDIRAALAQAVADRGVERIVLFVDSPGGSAMGAEECAAEVAAAAKIKPVLTFVDGLGASAALWIGSQANKVVATPSSEVGSVGVIAIHADLSKALRSAGVQMSMVVSKISPLKAEGNPYEPLGTEARKRVQADVDAIASRFVRDVAKGRRMPMQKVIADFGHGRTMFADAAQSVGMVDGVAGTIAGALQVRLSGSQSTAAALARRRRLRLLTMSAH
jgi:signal peptide peptidase SppA